MTAAGVVLLIIGAMLAASETHNPTHGVAGSAGVTVMALGIALALAGAGAGIAIGVGSGALLLGAGGAALAVTVTKSSAVRRRRVRGGAEGLIGEIGTVRSWSQDDGSVALQGAVWRARRSPCAEPEDAGELPELHTGDRVVVERLSGLTVSVRPAEAWELP